MTQNQSSKSIDLADIFGSVVNQLRTDRPQINALDSNGNHGDNALHNFEVVANTLTGLRSQDAGNQLRQAATALQQNGKGATANLYSQGLLQAASSLQGKNGIGVNEIMPLLQGLVGGVQSQTKAQPGQGTMLDALLPAVTTFANARSNGSSTGGAITAALGAALSGSQKTYPTASLFGSNAQQASLPRTDPGAASANSLIKGLFQSLTHL